MYFFHNTRDTVANLYPINRDTRTRTNSFIKILDVEEEKIQLE